MLPDPNSYQAIGWLAVALGGLAVAAHRVMQIVRDFRGSPPAEQLHQTTEQLANRMDKLEAEFTEIRHEMRSDRNTILAAGEERAIKLHDRINHVLEAVSELRGRLVK